MRGTARSLFVSIAFLACAGFIPVGSCAKGCRLGCGSGTRVASRSARNLDGLAHTLPRYSSRPLIVPAPSRLGGALGHTGGELGHVGSTLDDAVRVLPEVEGNVSSLARTPSPRGVTVATDSATRSFGRDYGRSLDALGVTPRQHEQLLDALDLTQTLTQTLVEQLAGTDDPATDDPFVRRRLDGRYTRLGTVLDARLSRILSPEQLARFYTLLGAPEVIAHRLATERPLTRGRAPSAPSP